MLYLFLAFYAAFGFSVSDMCTKYMLDNGISNLQYLFWAHGILFLLLTVIFMGLGIKYSLPSLTNGSNLSEMMRFPSGKLGLIILISTIFSFTGLLVLIYAFKISKNIGYTSAAVGTVSLMTLIFSWIFFNKKPEPVGILGVLSILFGVFLISKTDN